MELEVLRKDMVAAMKAKDKVTKEAVSSLISAVKKVAIDEGCRDEIKSDLVDRVILKELKTVKEQLDTCPESREDLKAEYQARYDVIAKYAPKTDGSGRGKRHIWTNRDWNIRTSDATATRQLIIRFTPEK